MIKNATLTFAMSLGLLLVGNVYSGQVDCEYDDNAEWPWLEERVCQKVDEKSVVLLSDAQSSGFAYCKSASSDPDGDGWGWENKQSCRVKTAIPNCLDPDSDPDNDGWGWENGRSCIQTNGKRPGSAPVCRYLSSDSDGDGWGFEAGKSCLITAESEFPICSEHVSDDDGDGWGYENNLSCKIISGKRLAVVFQQNFELSSPGIYTGDDLNKQWDTPFWHLGFNQGRVHIVAESGRGNAMRITYPANAYGAAGAGAFLSDVKFGVDLPKSYAELYVSYDVKFADGFDFVRGGKLPGLCGYDDTSLPVHGCNTGGGFPSGFDGWSARGMWREDGALQNYVYHSAQNNFFGDDEYWGVRAIPGQWHRIQHRVVLNTVGQSNGLLEAWFDGKKVLSKSNFAYRKKEQVGINLFYFSTFFGGNDPSWAPTQDQFVYFDNFRISTKPESETFAKALAQNDVQLPEPIENSGSTKSSGVGSAGLSFLFLLAFRRRRAGVLVRRVNF